MSAAKLPLAQKIRYGLIAFGMTGIIAAGSLTGASLKSQQEYEAKKKQVLEAPVDEKIAILEQQKQHLNSKIASFQQKLDIFHERKRVRDMEAQLQLEEKSRR